MAGGGYFFAKRACDGRRQWIPLVIDEFARKCLAVDGAYLLSVCTMKRSLQCVFDVRDGSIWAAAMTASSLSVYCQRLVAVGPMASRSEFSVEAVGAISCLHSWR